MAIHEQDSAQAPYNIQLKEQPVYAMGRIGTYEEASDRVVYEIHDHVGNVRATFYDNAGTTTLLSWADFYPHGGVMPGRNESTYRYNYQSQESEAGNTNRWQNFELRMHNPDLARWMAPDPMGQFHSPYLSMGNNPVSMVDPSGGYVDWPDWLNRLFGRVGPTGQKKIKGEGSKWSWAHGSGVTEFNDGSWSYEGSSYDGPRDITGPGEGGGGSGGGIPGGGLPRSGEYDLNKIMKEYHAYMAARNQGPPPPPGNTTGGFTRDNTRGFDNTKYNRDTEEKYRRYFYSPVTNTAGNAITTLPAYNTPGGPANGVVNGNIYVTVQVTGQSAGVGLIVNVRIQDPSGRNIINPLPAGAPPGAQPGININTLNQNTPSGVRLRPQQTYPYEWKPRTTGGSPDYTLANGGMSLTISISVVSANTGLPVAGVNVAVFVSFGGTVRNFQSPQGNWNTTLIRQFEHDGRMWFGY